MLSSIQKYVYLITLFFILIGNYNYSHASRSNVLDESGDKDVRKLSRHDKGKGKDEEEIPLYERGSEARKWNSILADSDFYNSSNSDTDDNLGSGVENRHNRSANVGFPCGNDSGEDDNLGDDGNYFGPSSDESRLLRCAPLEISARENSQCNDEYTYNQSLHSIELVGRDYDNLQAAFRVYGQYEEITDLENGLIIHGEALIGGDNEINRAALFMQRFDHSFFKKASNKTFAFQIFMALTAITVSNPMCALIMYSTGDALYIPTEGPIENLAIGWILGTTAPAYMKQFWDLGKEVGEFIFRENSLRYLKAHNFSSVGSSISREDKHSFHSYASLLQKMSKTALLASAAVDSLIPLFLLINLETNYTVFLGITSAPFYLSWLKTTYNIGARRIDDLFDHYVHSDGESRIEKKLLMKYLKKFQKLINDENNKDYTEKVFGHLQEMISSKAQNGRAALEGLFLEDPFGFSLFFLREARDHYNHIPSGDGVSEDIAKARNLADRLGAVETKKLHHKALRSLGVLNAGISALSQYMIVESVLESGFLWWGMDPSAAYYLSAGLAVFNMVFDTITHFSLQQEAFKGYLKILSSRSYTDFLLPRKMIGLIAYINSAWFTLPFSLQALKVLDKCPAAIKYALLGSQFLNKTNSNNDFFNTSYNDQITSILLQFSKTKKPPLSVKRACINHFVKNAEECLRTLDKESIKLLYDLILNKKDNKRRDAGN